MGPSLAKGPVSLSHRVWLCHGELERPFVEPVMVSTAAGHSESPAQSPILVCVVMLWVTLSATVPGKTLLL